jgi:hypothetical protein
MGEGRRQLPQQHDKLRSTQQYSGLVVSASATYSRRVSLIPELSARHGLGR